MIDDAESRMQISRRIDLAGYPDIFDELRKENVDFIDLLSHFRARLDSTVDLYNPNDTHLSVQGYLAMAEKVADGSR